MAFFSIAEVIDALIMTAILGFLFQDAFRYRTTHDYLAHTRKTASWNDFLFAAAIIAPSIILHELGHKFTAIAFGHHATFFGACTIQQGISGLTSFPCFLMAAAIAMKLAGASILFFIPAYVAYTSQATPLQSALIALAGPLVNLLLWTTPQLLLRYNPSWWHSLQPKTQQGLILLARINLFLFVFNILPIPGFDGYWVLTNLFKLVLSA
ncbi:M50 family peptidase [Candidatus Woesearchaeota archaeon]|nr:MAG: M50 family peptidase [Candidatus Woesearchaeota archaeon]